MNEELIECRRVTLTLVRMKRGAGTEANPVREVTRIFDDDGRCVAEHDPRFPTPWYAPEDILRRPLGDGDGVHTP
jgi:hypothetical protein